MDGCWRWLIIQAAQTHSCDRSPHAPLRAPSAVVLASEDRIVPVGSVENYLLGRLKVDRKSERGRDSASKGFFGSGGVRRVVTLQGQSHGSFLVDEAARAAVLETISDAQVMFDWLVG